MDPETLTLWQDVLDTLERVGCPSWCYPGPDAPFDDMATCYVCQQVHDIRAYLAGCEVR